MLHLRWVTDIHNTPEVLLDKRSRYGDPSAPKKFIDASENRRLIHSNVPIFVKESFGIRPALVIDTGDDIDTALDKAQDEISMREFQDMWSPIAGISERTPGNHDMACFTRGELSQHFGFTTKTKTYKFPEATVIIWAADTQQLKRDNKTYFNPDDTDMSDLALALDGATPRKPILIFSHIPIHSNSYEEPLDDIELANPDKSHYSNYKDILQMIEERHLNVLTFAGHRHFKKIITVNDRITMHGMDRFVRSYDKPPLRPKGVNYADIFVDPESNGSRDVDVHFHGPLASTLRY